MNKDKGVNISWVFLTGGIVAVLTGIFVDQAALSASLQKAEILAGAGFLIAAIVAMLVV